MDLLSIRRSIKERRWTFLGSTLLALVFLIFAPTDVSVFTPQYYSTAKVLLTPPSVVSADGSGGRSGTFVQSWCSDESTLKELVGSEELLTRVLNRLQSKQPWMEFRSQIQVQFITKGASVTLFQVSVVANKPEASQQETLVLVEELITYVQELSAREYANTRRFLVDLLNEASAQVKKTQQQLIKAKGGVPKDGLDPETRRKIELEAEHTKFVQEAAALRAQLTDLQASSNVAKLPWAIIELKNAGLDGRKDALAKEKAILQDYERLYLPNTEEVIAQREKVAKVEESYNEDASHLLQSLVQERQAGLAQKESSIKVIEAELKRMQKAAPTDQQRWEYTQAERQLQVAQENFLTLSKRLYEAKLNEQLSKRQGAFSILERPQPGAILIVKQPKTTNRPGWQRYAFGVPFCFIFGIGVVVLQDYLRSSMRLHPRIEEALDLPVIGMVPRLSRDISGRWESMKKTAVTVVEDPRDEAGD